MLETPHVAVGAAIAAKIPNPFVSIPLALASHFVLDTLPHWNPHSFTETQKFGKITTNTKTVALIDVGLALITGFFVASQSSLNPAHGATIIFASFFSVLPDVVKAPYFLMGIKKGIIQKWVMIERKIQNEVAFIPGMAVQLSVIAASLWWALS